MRLKKGTSPCGTIALLSKLSNVTRVYAGCKGEIQSLLILCDIMEVITNELYNSIESDAIQELNDHRKSIKSISEECPLTSPIVAQRVVRYEMMLNKMLEAKSYQNMIFKLVHQIRAVIEFIVPDSQDSVPPETLAMINKHTANAIGMTFLELISEEFELVEYVIMLLKGIRFLETKWGNPSESDEELFTTDVTKARVKQMINTAINRLHKCLRIIDRLHNCRLQSSLRDGYIRTLTNGFRIFVGVHKMLLAQKEAPSGRYSRTVETVSTEVIPTTYKLIRYINEMANEEERISAKSIRRECQLIPNLVYQIEDYEQLLLKVNKTWKLNLDKYISKKDHWRDFKIQSSHSQSPELSQYSEPESVKRPRVDEGESQSRKRPRVEEEKEPSIAKSESQAKGSPRVVDQVNEMRDFVG